MNSTSPSSSERVSLERLLELLNQKCSSLIVESSCDKNHVIVRIAPASVSAFFRTLKEDADLAFNMLLSVTAVDWMDNRDDRFEVVYHLLSLKNYGRLRVKVNLPEHKPEIDSVAGLWQSANFMEREAWDMLGIVFKGHPDLRRILMYEEFKGHPLRKDYPVQAKQPRVAMRSPEVENTARQMQRPELVKIQSRRPGAVIGGGPRNG